MSKPPGSLILRFFIFITAFIHPNVGRIRNFFSAHPCLNHINFLAGTSISFKRLDRSI